MTDTLLDPEIGFYQHYRSRHLSEAFRGRFLIGWGSERKEVYGIVVFGDLTLGMGRAGLIPPVE